MLLLGRKAMTNLDSILKGRDITDKGLSSQSYGFSSSHVWMWELEHKEDWALKNWSCWTVVLEKVLESHLDCKEIQPVHPKRNQSWIFIGRTDAEAVTPILWPPNVKNWLIGKDPDVGKDWRQERRMTEDEMVEWHHWRNGHEFEQALGFGEVQGSLACMLQSMGLQRLWHDWVAELNWNGSGVEGKKVVKILENHRCKKGKEVVRMWEKMLTHWQLSEWGTRMQRKRIAKVQMSKFRHSV